MKPNVPFKTGRLRNSMVPIFTPFKGVLGTSVPYASRVHNLHPVGEPYINPSLNKQAKAGFLALGVKNADKDIQEAMNTALAGIVAELVK